MKTASLALILISLGACNRDQPPGPTAEQSAGLNEADDMLNQLDTNEEGPEAKAPDPSANAG